MRMKRRKMKNLRPIRRLVPGKQDFQLTMKLYKNCSEILTPEERENLKGEDCKKFIDEFSDKEEIE